MELRTYIEKWTQEDTGLSLDEKIEEGRKHLFDFDYPFFDEDYRPIFEKNFIKNFYTREIGFETEELFKLKLDTWLSINIGYYNKLFESEKMVYDPLLNTEMEIIRDKENARLVDDTRAGLSDTSSTGSENTSASGNTTDSRDNFNRDIKSDTPDQRLQLTTGTDGSGVIEYASEITENKDVGTTSSNATNQANTSVENKGKLASQEDYTRDEKENEQFTENRKGKIGQQSYSSLMMEYRQSLLRVEKIMFEEMNQLFMLVY